MACDTICYDRSWTKDTIAQLQEELYLVDDLIQSIRNMYELSPESRRLYAQVGLELEALRKSLNKAKVSLEFYTETMEARLSRMEQTDEDNLLKSSDLFFNCGIKAGG